MHLPNIELFLPQLLLSAFVLRRCCRLASLEGEGKLEIPSTLIEDMAILTSFRLFSAKLPQSLLHSKIPIFRTLVLTTPLILPQHSFFKSITIQRIPTKPPSSSPSSSSTPVSVQPIEQLPPKLQDIVRLFQAAQEPKAKYEQLLFYGRNLTPLGAQFKTSENKVQGCVSQVWVRAYLDSGKNVAFEADSDSVLTKGLTTLLVKGLSGRPVEEILMVSPDFVVLLGLQQSLTPSRNNGFLNMLKLMQKKALLLYAEAEGGGEVLSSDEKPIEGLETSNLGSRIDTSDIRVSSEVGIDDSRSHAGGGVALGRRGERIKEKLERDLQPIELQVEDISYQHAGHAGVSGSNGETHFNVRVVSKEFEGKSLVKRHRLIYDLLQDELQSGLHALSIVAKTPHEVDSR